MRHEIGQQAHFVVIDAPHNMMRRNVARMMQARSLHNLTQRMQGLIMKMMHALGLAGHMQRLLAMGILRRHTRRALARMATLSLDATQRKHKTAR